MKTGIALGSNLGDRLQNLRDARKALLALQNVNGEALCSRVYETEPVGCEPGAAAYLNAVIEIGCDGNPAALLGELQDIEKKLGRPSRHPRNAPRTIDLDIIYFGEMRLELDDIQIPHPRLHSRRFVLAPLADIRPEMVLPGRNETVAALLAKLPPEPRADIFSESW